MGEGVEKLCELGWTGDTGWFELVSQACLYMPSGRVMMTVY